MQRRHVFGRKLVHHRAQRGNAEPGGVAQPLAFGEGLGCQDHAPWPGIVAGRAVRAILIAIDETQAQKHPPRGGIARVMGGLDALRTFGKAVLQHDHHGLRGDALTAKLRQHPIARLAHAADHTGEFTIDRDCLIAAARQPQ